MLIDVGQELWGHSPKSERLHRARTGKCTTVCNRKHGYGDDCVEYRRETLDSSKFDGNNKGRELGVCSRRVEEIRVVRRHNQTYNEQGHHIEECDSPLRRLATKYARMKKTYKYLLGCRWDSLLWVGGFSRAEADQLRSSKCKRGSHEDGTETMEAVSESARIVPVFRTNVATSISWYAATVDDDTQDDETHASYDFNDGQDEFD